MRDDERARRGRAGEAGGRGEDGNGRASASLFEPGDRVAVLGLGVSGVAAARLCHALGAEVYASDAAATEGPREAAERLNEEGIDAEAGDHDIPRILECRTVIVSPGIDPSTEVRRAVREAGVRTVAEVELAFRHLPSRLIGITGTNGKTTTTALCGHLLETAGWDAVTAGNIGRPLSEVALLEDHPEWVVVELSSFQLADLERFDPTIGVMLNLAGDHLDRYASLDRYYADKARLFTNATEDSLWVVNGDDEAVLSTVKGVPGTQYRASLQGRPSPGAWLDEDGWLRMEAPGREERWLEVDDLLLVGSHNVMNALLGGLAVALAGVEAEAISEGLSTFRGLPHRLQPVGTFEGVLWVNDSKGTNCSATRVAIEAFDRPVVVLLGGRHKGESYAVLLPVLQGSARGVIAFGEAAPKIVAELRDGVDDVRVAGGLEAVVREARAMARPGDVVLFSPACSSYDMFPNYEVRGRTFVELVEKIHGEGS